MLLAMSAIDDLLTLADAYGRAERIETTTVSWRVFGDTKKLGALKHGKDIQVKRFEAALQWFSDHWPDGTPWPDVQRPDRAPANDAPPSARAG